jgi:hypothetical protein
MYTHAPSLEHGALDFAPGLGVPLPASFDPHHSFSLGSSMLQAQSLRLETQAAYLDFVTHHVLNNPMHPQTQMAYQQFLHGSALARERAVPPAHAPHGPLEPFDDPATALDASEVHPILVNGKQFHRIMARRQQRMNLAARTGAPVGEVVAWWCCC